MRIFLYKYNSFFILYKFIILTKSILILMDQHKKCSNKNHSEMNAVSYCLECNIYLCNKCSNYHSELLENHHNYNLNKNIGDLFTGKCTESNHKLELKYFCRNHNKLCCAACLSKIKDKENGQHHDCNVCSIEEIKEEKKNKFKENIKYLEEISDKIENSINELKRIFQQINESKEEIKAKITNTFTKLRNAINEREDEIIVEVDNIFDKKFLKESIIKHSEKLPNKIKISLENWKLLDKEWDDNKRKLNSIINDCINIENNIKNIDEINKSIEKCNSQKINIKFIPDNDDGIKEVIGKIKKFGELFDKEENLLDFKFRPGNNYNVTNNGLVATKNNGGNNWNCTIFGDKEIPKNKISKWKIKIKTDTRQSTDILIGIGPNNPNNENNFYIKCWSFISTKSILLLRSGNQTKYNNHSGRLKKGDIVEVIVDRQLGNLSFAVNGSNYGIACSDIPKEDELYPTVSIYDQNIIVEIV